MYDSIYNIWEQQQKLTDTYNQIYSLDLLKMQQRYSDIVTRMQSSITALQDISGLSTLAEQAMRMKDFDTDKFLSAWNHTMGIDRQLIQNMSSTLANMNVGQFVTMAQRMVFPTEAIINYSQITSIAQMESVISNLSATIQSIPDFVWDTLSDEEGYSKEEIQEELEIVREEGLHSLAINGLTPDQIQKGLWNQIAEKHPKLARFLAIIVFVIGISTDIINLVETTNNTIVPMAQNIVVKLQGKEDIFYVKVESAKLYTKPDSHSKVITKILYAEEVMQIDSVKMWDKVTYVNPDGEEITGWIAKRNLMTYKDYEFNSDDLYDLD